MLKFNYSVLVKNSTYILCQTLKHHLNTIKKSISQYSIEISK